MKDYTGKQVFLGIDVHQKQYVVQAICDGVKDKKGTLAADPEAVIAFCLKHFPGATIFSVYEAGFSGFTLHRVLVKNGIQNRVIHAAAVEAAAGNRVKTDKRDALKLATQLAAGRLRGIQVPDEAQEKRRAITRMRETTARRKASVANQMKSFLQFHGIKFPRIGRKVCPAWIKDLKAFPMAEELRIALKVLIETWELCDTQIKNIAKEINKQAAEDSAKEKVYRSMPGMGPISARTFANELGDLSQFRNQKELSSYVGLTPSEHSSGGHIRKGHITKQGKPILRKLLVQVAWMTCRKDPAIKKMFERIAKRAGGKRAIVAVARHLLGRLKACFRSRCLYKIGMGMTTMA